MMKIAIMKSGYMLLIDADRDEHHPVKIRTNDGIVERSHRGLYVPDVTNSLIMPPSFTKEDFMKLGRPRTPDDLYFGDAYRPPTVFMGHQWKVTAYGVECLTRSYHIEARLFWERDWESHMHDKPWCDGHEFSLALEKAKQVHWMKKPRRYNNV